MMLSFGVVPASVWNANARSTGMFNPALSGSTGDPPASQLTHSARLRKSSL